MPPRARKPKAQTGPAQASFVENSHGRHDDDFYRTPGEVTAALCNELVLRGITPRTILDVGCGDGAEGYGKLRWKGRVDFRGNGNTDRVSHEWLVIGPGFEGQFVRVPRSPVATHEQLGLFGKGTS